MIRHHRIPYVHVRSGLIAGLLGLLGLLTLPVGSVGAYDRVLPVLSPPEALPSPVNTHQPEMAPRLSTDGLTLYYVRWTDPWHVADIFGAKRPGLTEPFTTVRILTELHVDGHVTAANWITPDGLTLYIQSNRPGTLGGYDLWVCSRSDTDSP